MSSFSPEQVSSDHHPPYTQALSCGPPLELIRRAGLGPGEVLFDGGAPHIDGATPYSADARFSALCVLPEAQLIIDQRARLSLRESLSRLERFTRSPLGRPAHRSARTLPFPVPLTACVLGYELGAQAHSGLSSGSSSGLSQALTALPTLWATQYAACYVWDAYEQRGMLCSLERGALERAAGRLKELASAPQRVRGAYERPLTTSPLVSSWSRAEHTGAIKEAQRLMREGELYQVNLTCALSAQLREGVSAEEVYLSLRDQNPAPFGALMRLDEERYVLCQSPERLLKWSARGEVMTEPIKGTAPRSLDPSEDQAQRAALLSSVKDRAEHTMIVDLERNDLGRVCQPGSVRVEALRSLRSFPTVHHLVSVVSGSLRPDVGLAELLMATFPGGSITGAPKRRAMEVIARLEAHPRGIYCGALGYLAPDGSGDLNLPIRTSWLQGRALTYHAGGGVVADSTPEGEWAELWVKARAVSRGLGWPDDEHLNKA